MIVEVVDYCLVGLRVMGSGDGEGRRCRRSGSRGSSRGRGGGCDDVLRIRSIPRGTFWRDGND
jgi:hypothetical protein